MSSTIWVWATPIAVSAVHGHGTGDLLDACLQYFPPEDEEEEDSDVIQVAIIGKPNVASPPSPTYPGPAAGHRQQRGRHHTGRHRQLL